MLRAFHYGNTSTALTVTRGRKKFGDFTGKFTTCFLNHGLLLIGQLVQMPGPCGIH